MYEGFEVHDIVGLDGGECQGSILDIGVNMSTSNTRHSAFRRRNMIFRVSASRGSNATCQIRQEMRYLSDHIPLPQLSSDPESA